MEWISVDDRLPDDPREVLVFCDDNTREIGVYSYKLRKWALRGDEYPNEDSRIVTHWCELPADPLDHAPNPS